jgi:hypothetical protein
METTDEPASIPVVFTVKRAGNRAWSSQVSPFANTQLVISIDATGGSTLLWLSTVCAQTDTSAEMFQSHWMLTLVVVQ